MKHDDFPARRLIYAALCAFLMVCLLQLPALAAGKLTDSLNCYPIDAFFGTCYYVPSSLGESCETFDVRSVTFAITPSVQISEAANHGEQLPFSAEMSFVSGDESLRDAVSMESEEGAYYLQLDNGKLTAPGTAVFHFRLESDNYVWEADKTLIILDFDEAPFFDLKNGEPVLYRKTGEAYSKYSFPKLYLTFNAARAYNLCREKAPDQEINPIASFDLTAAEGSPAFTEEVRYDEYLNASSSVTFPEEAVYDLRASISMGNVIFSLPFQVVATGYQIEGPDAMAPGETVSFTVSGSDQTFVWSIAGEGAVVDASSGEITSSPDAAESSVVILTAAPPAPGLAVSRKITISSSLLGRFTYSPTARLGFTVPCPVSSGWTPLSQLPQAYVFVSNYGPENNFQVQCFQDITSTAALILTDEAARREYDSFYEHFSTKVEMVSPEKEIISVDGHAALVSTYAGYMDGQYSGNYGDILFARNGFKTFLRFIRLGPDEESTYRFTLDELKYVASMISYDENWSKYTASDAAVSVTEKNGTTLLPAGRSLSFSASFANTELVNRDNGNDAVTWSVCEAGTGNEVPEARISQNGQLSVDAKLASPVTLEIKAVSEYFLTRGSCEVTALPQVKKLLIDPAELFFYVGTDAPQTVRVLLEPDTVPPMGITWTPAAEGIVEIADGGDGTASLRPLSAGNTTFTVREPGGKTARLRVSVLEPVASVEITLKGSAKAGGTVNAQALLSPAAAGNKRVEWSLSVGEDVASVNQNGQIRLAKDVPAGTVITVTCKALGAAEPVTASAELTVE